MSEHLPECWAKDPSDPPAWCICDELRACERRVSDALVKHWGSVHWYPDHHAWEVYQEGRRSGINAAEVAMAECPIAIREAGILLLNRDVALASIHELKGGQ
jgi:hypothetical protein